MSFNWQKLAGQTKPFLVLAPMEDVTDTVFRKIVKFASVLVEKDIIYNSGQKASEQIENFLKNTLNLNRTLPDVTFTEFTCCEGLQSDGRLKVIHRLKYDKIEKPLIAQVWGITPDDYYKTAKLITELGFDGIDINMGCPVKKVVKQGACSGLIRNPTLAKEIVDATKAGTQGKIPVSIKTRIGFSQIDTEYWCGFLLQQCKPAALTVHGRTVAEESKVPCNWDEIAKVVKINDDLSKSTIGLSKKAKIESWKKKAAKIAVQTLIYNN